MVREVRQTKSKEQKEFRLPNGVSAFLKSISISSIKLLGCLVKQDGCLVRENLCPSHSSCWPWATSWPREPLAPLGSWCKIRKWKAGFSVGPHMEGRQVCFQGCPTMASPSLAGLYLSAVSKDGRKESCRYLYILPALCWPSKQTGLREEELLTHPIILYLLFRRSQRHHGQLFQPGEVFLSKLKYTTNFLSFGVFVSDWIFVFSGITGIVTNLFLDYRWPNGLIICSSDPLEKFFCINFNIFIRVSDSVSY